ncbi:MAG: NAD+ synthase [Candidatus Thermoplasmatota archaeon]|nr:NAD+ synthase [Candidatus Thermoplasmatota archaeon]
MLVNKAFNPEEATIIIKDFIKTYVENSGCSGVVIGLSGGIDSAVTAILCQQAIGRKKTLCIFLPDDVTPYDDRKHLELIVKSFKINFETREITKLVNSICNFSIVSPNSLAVANIKARLRMTLLFEYANMTNSLVCGTTNKSEYLVGYFTKYGDAGVDLMPMGDLYKSQLLEVARYLKIPEEIIKKPPTAGLIKDQTDEKELKISYEKLDQILYGLELKMDPIHIAQIVGSTQKEVRRIQNLRVKSQHKRRTPLIPKIGLRTPSLDWRSPIQIG